MDKKPFSSTQLPIVGLLVNQREVITPECTVEVVSKRFFANKILQSLAVVEDLKPIGIVHRYQITDIFLLPFGRELYGRKPISQLMDNKPLLIEYDTSIEEASQYIIEMMRSFTVIEDFIIVNKGKYLGIGTLFNLLEKMTELQISRLKAENTRLAAELSVTHRLQSLLLPRPQELIEINELDIACYAESAEEVGGDYYDVLPYKKGVKIGIGDVTGHGLESGMLMLMAQTVVRTLLEAEETEPKRFLQLLNYTLFHNAKRMGCDKSMSLALLDYEKGVLRVTGQHEEILIVRESGEVERFDTDILGFPIGLEENISHFVKELQIPLAVGDCVVLYSDGVTEAVNKKNQLYGLERLCAVVARYHQLRAEEIKAQIVADLYAHIDGYTLLDDVTLIVFKIRT